MANEDCPLLSLPRDLLIKIICDIPTAQWPFLELVDTTFRELTLLAWRTLRHVNVEEDFLIKWQDPSESQTMEALFLEQLSVRSPFLTSITGICLNKYNADMNEDSVNFLSKFEHLESIRARDTMLLGFPFENFVHFLESSRSRSCLTEMDMPFCMVYGQDPPDEVRGAMTSYIDRFPLAFTDGHEIRGPLLLEKFSFAADSLTIPLHCIDASRMTVLRLGSSKIGPDHLVQLIDRGSNLRWLEFAFLHCESRDCAGPRLQANRTLLAALASLENLSTLKLCSNMHLPAEWDAHCLRFQADVIEMFEMMGRRGCLEKFSFDHGFVANTFGTYSFNDGRFHHGEICAAIAKYLPHLRSIEFPATHVEEHELMAIIDMKELEEIDFMYFGAYTHYFPMSEEIVTKLGTHPNLRRLALDTFTHSYDPENEQSLIALGKSKILTDLRIQFAELITKKDMIAWGEGFGASLRTLMLSGLGHEDKEAEDGLIALIRKAHGLRVLIVRGLITDRLLEAVAECCPDLEQLGVNSRSDAISLRGLQMVVDRCKRLRKLGGMEQEVRKHLKLGRYRKLAEVEMSFENRDFFEEGY